MNWIRRTSLLALAAIVIVTGAGVALAATVSEVVDDVAATGVYLDSGVSISESDATEIVSSARNDGSRFSLVVLDDTPLGGNSAFAEAILDDLNVDGGTIFVLSPDDVGWVSDNEGFSEAELDAAFEFANDEGGSDAEYAANFVVGLFGESVAVPDAVTATTAAASAAAPAAAEESSGGGGSGFLFIVVIVAGLGLLLFWLMRRGRKPTVNAAAEQMAKARAAVQKQVDAIANDILDMEDEVRVAGNAEADEYYNSASATYRTVTERLHAADTPQEFVDLSNDLDVAIWQLDCAEAVLDNKPKPARPEPKRLEPAATSSTDRVTVPAPRSDYQRRPGRRSSYMGPGVMEILIGVAGQVLAGGGRRRSGGGLGGLLGGLSGSRSTPTRRSGSGGGVVPGPGSSGRSTSSRTPRSPRRSRPRRSGGGRVRGGGKRRR